MFYIGDTHGNHNIIKYTIDVKKIRDTHLIHVGDFGVGFIRMEQEVKNLMEIDKFLAERNLIMHVFRGNHDNPLYFKGDMIFDNLKLHPDYTIIEVEGKRILGVGGAISIDRVPRRKNNLMEVRVNQHSEKRYHWDDEVFVLDREKLEKVRDIDMVVTHTTPDFCHPVNQKDKWPFIVKQFFGDDPNLGNDLTNERAMLTEMCNIVKKNNNITHWIYGHFHTHNNTIMGNCVYTCLGINEFYEVKDYDDYEDELNKKYGG